MFRYFRRNPSPSLVEKLHADIMNGARQPAFYETCAVSDTIEGRFELVALHATLLVRRLNKASAPGPELAHDLTDAIFANFDIALRESGVGDLSVPKKIKKMAENYLGRAKAYGEALDGGGAAMLASAIARNIYGVEDPADAQHADTLARYARTAEKKLAETDNSLIYNAGFDWPPVDGKGRKQTAAAAASSNKRIA